MFAAFGVKFEGDHNFVIIPFIILMPNLGRVFAPLAQVYEERGPGRNRAPSRSGEEQVDDPDEEQHHQRAVSIGHV